MKRYFRSVVEEYPHAAAEGYHAFGWRGLYLATGAFVFRYLPFPVSVAGFGRIHSWPEATNFVDNFSLGELRSEEVEEHLRALPESCVVDVGVNVGVTCRWWLSLADHVHVIGIDMFQEALDFTTSSIDRLGALQRWRPICAAVGESDKTVEIRFDNPLEGTSRLDSATGERSRSVRVQPLDAVLSPIGARRIGLLKLDIEGSAGQALKGAPTTLARSDYVVVETHSNEETATSSTALIGAGFTMFHCHGRTMWWRRNS